MFEFGIKSSSWSTLAHEVLPRSAWGYVHGDAGQRQTENNNLASFAKWGLIPKRLIPVERVDLSVEILGMRLAGPILIAPVGVSPHKKYKQDTYVQVLQIFHRDKEFAVARAATKTNTTYIMSSASSSSIEDVAEASGDGLRFFQLYVVLHRC